MKKLEILVYENSSGFANYSYKICNELANQSEQKITYITDDSNIYLEEINENVNKKPILKVPAKIKSKRILWITNRIYVGIYNIVQRNRYIKKNKVDILNIQSTLSVLEQFFIGGIIKKTKVILTVHDVIPPVRSFYWTKKSLKKLYKKVPLLIVHSEDNKRQLIEQFQIQENKIKVIHHGTDTKYTRINKDECYKNIGIKREESKLFLFFGQIREQKGLDTLISAVEKTKKTCRLLIAGAMPNGENFSKYQKLISKTERFVQMIQFIDESDVDYIFQAVDAVVFPYKYFYSQSGVFMQCIKYRKPIIATDVGSFKQYIEHYGIGIVAEPDNIESLAEALDKFALMSVDEIKSMENNLEVAAYENSWEKAAELYIKCINFLI